MNTEKETAHRKGVDSLKVISVVELKFTIGAGTQEDPVRQVTEYWSLDGSRLGFVDSLDLKALEEFIDSFINGPE